MVYDWSFTTGVWADGRMTLNVPKKGKVIANPTRPVYVRRLKIGGVRAVSAAVDVRNRSTSIPDELVMSAGR